ncbi:hydroxymethylglutaryl-CoA lyase [Desulfocucumis palustris]|uniref:Hydroxymethylglutaryl-CoA lyase n=1 Tax=Desulfocucumis palustris TaxID=1898651 RepID=A0A2L2XBZ3_9FIRM|nr:hydroxymethylglutaryl-CoA lyase [Desulfocucumis palustris]GBF33847.1 hydroxymethylglutaryl-CoA lyase [Desulfocucumis palustris]
MHWPGKITVREVGPRDGLQNIREFVPTEKKVQMIRALAAAGVVAIEAVSFVSPRAVPQMSDAYEVLAALGDLPGNVTLSALAGNLKGMERAAGSGVREVVAVVSASETHNRANLNLPVERSLEVLKDIGAMAASAGIRLRGAVATAFGCPYQGEIPEYQVKKVVEGMLAAGMGEITLADTAGMADPRQVYELVRKLSAGYPGVAWALHFHDARGLGLANAVTGIQAGVTVLESSAGGLGGCPFIPGAAGNIATEDLVYMLHRMGMETGVDIDGILGCGRMLEGIL